MEVLKLKPVLKITDEIIRLKLPLIAVPEPTLKLERLDEISILVHLTCIKIRKCRL